MQKRSRLVMDLLALPCNLCGGLVLVWARLAGPSPPQLGS